ncbi:hypothetical protein PBAL39_06456 [Pedobacter sp. BAL39]|uniref:DUF1269 domain-containing protein n=1 Tax=Pedobacter sp. BAL39 TaxID=391596 RepID=UPI0001559A35|nr:DUF1269 domain-containing protein [Pedobacter sp. BAL39]EDM35799.1 hypothetical protein PBAL39_06456 [Pedobacter sp. BAL39]
MEKMIQALFDTEEDAFKGLQVVQQLDVVKDLSIGEIYVLAKDLDGKIAIRSAKDTSEGMAAVGGGILGGLLGLLAGPLGLIVGVAGGMIAGAAGETLKAEELSDYLDDIAANIPDGKAVLIAHIWEDWETPLDTMLSPLTTDIRRFSINEKFFLPVQTEMDKLEADIIVADQKLGASTAQDGAEWEATLVDLKRKKAALQNKMDKHHDYREKTYREWVDQHPQSLEEHDLERKTRLEKRISEQKHRLEQLRRDR